MVIPKPNQTCYWNDCGEVRQVFRRDGFCESKSVDRVPVRWEDADGFFSYADVSVEELYGTPAEAYRAAMFWLSHKLAEVMRVVENIENGTHEV